MRPSSSGPASVLYSPIAKYRDPQNGATYQYSATKLIDLSRGSSNTYLYGEKYLQRDNYLNGDAGNDNECVYAGFDNDNSRSSGWQPYRDAAGFDSYFSFGSAHPAGFNMAYCDGSVHSLTFTMSPAFHAFFASTKEAPALRYSASENPAWAPAPF